MGLTAYAGTKLPLPEPYQEPDYSSLGTASAVDNTGVIVDTSKFGTLQFIGTPSADANATIQVEGTPDGTNYAVIDTIAVVPGNGTFWRFYTGYSDIRIKTTVWAAGTVALIGKRIPWHQFGNWATVSVGP